MPTPRALLATLFVLSTVAAHVALPAQSYRAAGSTVRAEPVTSSVAQLTDEARRTFQAELLSHAPPGWSRAVRSVERRLQLAWRGPDPVLLVAPDDGRGFACTDSVESSGGLCRGRFEAIRTMTESDTVVATVIILAESALHAPDVWEHELTHAVLAQYGRLAESQRHDRRFFAARARGQP